MEQEKNAILLVDDEQNILFALKRELHSWAKENNLEVHIADSARAGLEFLLAEGDKTLLIISDLRMPEMKGSDFLLEVKRQYPAIMTILLSGYSEAEEIGKAVSAGIFSYILKPWNSQYLLAEVQKAYEFGENRRQNAAYHKKIEDELRWAGEMQKSLLKPNLPGSEGIEFRVTYRPAPGLFCSGDYYDVISAGTDRYLILFGDVSGHGVKAAIITGILKAVIGPEYLRGMNGKKISPNDLLSWLNQRMQFEFRTSSDLFISFFAGILDIKENYFLYANAGQNHPFLISGRNITELPISGPALGVSRTPLYTENAVKFLPDDILFFYTDGLTEVGPDISAGQLLQKVPYGPDFHQRIILAALETAGTQAFTDDVTILTAKRRAADDKR